MTYHCATCREADWLGARDSSAHESTKEDFKYKSHINLSLTKGRSSADWKPDQQWGRGESQNSSLSPAMRVVLEFFRDRITFSTQN
jgi:hypothetical protein